VSGNPVGGVKRPMANGKKGSTPALGDALARKLLEAPPADTPKAVCDRAILATQLYHGMRRQSCAGCGSATCRAVRAWCIFGSRTSGARSGSFRCMPWRSG